jgi:hypothetical protein
MIGCVKLSFEDASGSRTNPAEEPCAPPEQRPRRRQDRRVVSISGPPTASLDVLEAYMCVEEASRIGGRKTDVLVRGFGAAASYSRSQRSSDPQASRPAIRSCSEGSLRGTGGSSSRPRAVPGRIPSACGALARYCLFAGSVEIDPSACGSHCCFFGLQAPEPDGTTKPVSLQPAWGVAPPVDTSCRHRHRRSARRRDSAAR